MSLNSINYNKEDEIINSITKISDDISSLREVTYSYINIGETGEDLFFNTTMFSDFIGSGFGKKKTAEENKNDILYAISMAGGKENFFMLIKEKVEKKINGYIKKLRNNIETIGSGKFENAETLVKVSKNLISALKFTKNAIPAELEKSGIPHGLTEIEIKQIIEKQDKYDKELFGDKVTDNLSYIEDTTSFLKYLVQKYGEKIGHEKIKRLEKYIMILEERGADISDNFNGDKSFNNDRKYVDSYIKKLGDYNIDREDYAEIFQLNFEIAGVPQKAEIGNYSYFYDSDKVFGIPDSDGYAAKSLEEMFRIPGHETTHYQNLQVTNEAGLMKLPGDMIKEEGLASIYEKLIQGIPLANINYMQHGFPPVVMVNLLNGDEFNDFSDIYTDILVMEGKISQKGELTNFVNRKKRGYFKDYPGGPTKDASYTIGSYEVLEYLKSEKPLENLYGGKISINDVESGKYIPQNFGNKFISPLLTAELIPFYIKNRDSIENGNFHKKFIEHIKQRYSFLENYFNNFNESELFSKTQRLKLLRIIRKFEESIKEGDEKKKKLEDSQKSS